MSDWHREDIEAAALVVMHRDRCGVTHDGKHVLCSSAWIPEMERESSCACHDTALAALNAASASREARERQEHHV